MPNPPHEMLHDIFRADSGLFSRVLRFVEVPFPEPKTTLVGNTDATERRKVLERHVDTVLEARTEDGPFLIAIEAQNEPDDKKLRNWAYYPAYLHELRGCPVVLIVVCRKAATAAWARKPYCIGLPDRPTLVSTPIVVGPDNLPRITDSAEILADPYFAVLCALAHTHDPDVGGILEPIAAALSQLEDPGFGIRLQELIERGLEGTAAIEIWRKIMSYIPLEVEFRSEYARENQAVGITESVLRILEHRGITVSPAARTHIAACTNHDLAKAWLDEAFTVASAEELTGLGREA